MAAKKDEGARIYNLFPRLVGNVKMWNSHFDRIKKMGFNWIYVNPFHYPGFSGSLYAPKDYYDFNPMFIEPSDSVPPMKQLENMLEEAHKRNLKVIMDLVINHTAKDHPFTKTHKDWYKTDENGEVVSPGAWDNGERIEWGDLAEIDNENSPDRKNLWKYWMDLVLFYIDKGFDGFRADAAYSVPSELWSYLIINAKTKNDQVKFFAESLGCTPPETKALAEAGFDFIFNSSKWWNFYEPWLMEQYNQTKNISPSISFPESHDTPRLYEEMGRNEAAVKQRMIFSAFFATGWMIPVGFEYGFQKKTDVVNTTPEDWEDKKYDLSDIIKKINQTKKKYMIFEEECDNEILDSHQPSVLAMKKTSKNGKERALILLNKNIHQGQQFVEPNLYMMMQVSEDSTIIDCSVENIMDQVPNTYFEYVLQPGEVKILYSKVK